MIWFTRLTQTAQPSIPPVRAPEDDQFIQRIAQLISNIGVELADISGAIDDLSKRIELQFKLLRDIEQSTQHVSNKSDSVAREASLSLQKVAAVEHSIGESQQKVTSSLSGIQSFTHIVKEIAAEITQLNQSMSEVGGIVGDIDSISEQVNLLALNARIEAARAGDAGRGFAVVAGEVKTLASQASRATEQIDETLGEINNQATQLATRSLSSQTQSEEIHQDTDVVKQLMGTVGKSVEEVSSQVGNITSNVHEVNQHCHQIHDALSDMTGAMQGSMADLSRASDRVSRLTGVTEELVTLTTNANVETTDSPFIKLAIETAAQTSNALEEAISKGLLSLDELFDRQYQPIPNTDPQEFSTRFNHALENLLAPIQKSGLSFSPLIDACVAVNIDGYMPRHIDKYHNPQRPNDPQWNASHCRSRRIYNDKVGLAAATSNKKFLLQYYRRDMGNGNFMMLKSLSAPITVQGRHWGALRIGYRPE